MELKGKKVLVFGAGKSGIGAADLLGAVGACPILYDGKADLDKESVLHKTSGNYELQIYAGELPKEVQDSLDLVVLSPGVPTDLPIVKGFYEQGLPVWGEVELAYETGKAMKILDPSIELVACGSSMSTNPTFGDWEQTILEHCYPCLDYISLHQYYGGQEKGTAEFLAQSLDMERYIETVLNICDYVRVKKKMSHKINICFDEWGVWSMSDVQVQKSVEDAPWQTAPAISEQIYTMEDALLFASMLMNFIKRADRVKIACQSLLTNISSCIMTEEDGGVWVQPVYYPFALMAKYAHGVTLDTRYTGDTYACSTFETVPCVDHVLVYDGQKHEVTAFFVNRMEESAEATVSLQGMEPEAVLKSIALFHEDKKATNQKEHDCVTPVELENVSCSGNEISVELVPLSFQMVQIRLK